jgi:hypothetical protein
MENNMNVLQKTKNRTAMWSNDTTSGYIPQGCESEYNTDTCILKNYSQMSNWKQLRCSTTVEWIQKMYYIHSGLLFSHKQKWSYRIYR